MIPVSAGETLPGCPSQCPDTIWTFFNDRWSAPPAEVREATADFAALDLRGDPRTIPMGARLTEVRLGPERQGSAGRDLNLAAFQFDGQVYFGSAQELFKNSRIVQA